MGGGDREVQDEVDLGVGDQLVDRQRPHALLRGDRLCAARVEVGDRDDPHGREPRERGKVLAGDRAEADDPHSQRLAHRMPLSMMVRTFGSLTVARSWPGVETKTRPLPHRRVQTAGLVTGRCQASKSRAATVVVASTSL
jgi:hypothetical protein